MRAFDRTPCGQNFRKTTFTVADILLVRPSQPSRTRRRPLPLRCRSPVGEARTPASGERSSSLFFLPVNRSVSMRADRCRGHEPAVARAEEPQYPARATHAPDVTARAAATGKVSRHSTPSETLAPALSRPYKKAPSTPQNTTPPQLPIPTLLSSSSPRKHPSSASVRRRVPKKSGHRWRRRRCQAGESSCRRRSASSPTTPASSPSSPAFEHLLSATAGELRLSEVDDGRAPLDSNPAAAYRFG
jgi:hypothetical protein